MQIISFVRNKRATTSTIELAKQGDQEAFVALLAENEINLYRVARGMLREVQDIEDAIQNTIINAYTNIKKLKKNEFFRTWLIRILINECNKVMKNNSKTIALEDVIENETEMDDVKNIDLTNAVNALEEDLRLVTVLFYFEDLPVCEIAKLLGIPEGTVKSRLSRSRFKLNGILKEEQE